MRSIDAVSMYGCTQVQGQEPRRRERCGVAGGVGLEACAPALGGALAAGLANPRLRNGVSS